MPEGGFLAELAEGAMKKRLLIWILIWATFVLVIAIGFLVYSPTGRRGLLGYVQNEPFVDGEPMSYWVRGLKDMDAEVRTTASKALSRLGPKASAAAPELAEALKDEAPVVRINAAMALLNMGDKARPAAAALAEALKDDVPFVRIDAILSLRRIGLDAQAVPILVAAIEDKENWKPPPAFYVSVRQLAVRTLGEMGTNASAAVPVLEETLKIKEDRSLFEETTRALGRIKSAGAARDGKP
jgi:HEAT repeat protein